MKLTLIYPNIGRMEHSLYVDEARMEPLPLGALAGMSPPDVEIVLYDDRMEPIPYDEPTDLVGITVGTFTARRAYEISSAFRQRGVPVVMGGMHATLLPDEVASHADSVVIGDAETIWCQLLDDARHGKLHPVYRAPAGPPQTGSHTRRDIFQGKGYLPVSLLQFSRGCPYSCDFCASSVYFHHTHHHRAVREVIREIEAQERHTLFFVDDNIVSHRTAAKELFRELIPLNVRWVSQASIDMTSDPELLELMVRSGCVGNVIGFESLDRRNLHTMHKQASLIGGYDSYAPQLAILRQYGLQTWAAFTIGHDYDTVESIERTLNFALEQKFTFAAFNVLMPYPTTPLYRRLHAEGRLLYDGTWWLHPDYRFNAAAFCPQRMSPDDLTSAGFRARARFSSIGSIIRRAFDFKTNMRTPARFAFYLAYNPLFRKETFKKQGMRLGLD